MNGKKTDVVIEPVVDVDPKTGLDIVRDYIFLVWADSGMKDKIMAVEGVHRVVDNGCKYLVTVDKCYDMAFVQKEVEATILCA